jgi:murein DD-endopeptidase MepM/ murein hydrolase activator NlpD
MTTEIGPVGASAGEGVAPRSEGTISEVTYPSRRAMREAERSAGTRAPLETRAPHDDLREAARADQPAGRRAARVAAAATPPDTITTAELDALFTVGTPITASVPVIEQVAEKAAQRKSRAAEKATEAPAEQPSNASVEQPADSSRAEAAPADAARAHDAGVARSRRVREKESGQLHEGSRSRRAPRRAIRSPRGAGVAEVVPHRPVGGRRRLASKALGVLAMVFSGGLLVATSLPANAFFVDTSSSGMATAATATAGVTIEAGGSTPSEVLRDDYTVSSFVQKFRINNTTGSFTNNPYGTIQWPFAAGVPMSAGFGSRDRPCAACSADHKGLDFVPGEGAPIQSIADGVVVKKQETDSGLGNYIVIEHEINGQKVESVYGHMGFNTITVGLGDAVRVGQQIGNVGNTGTSTGAHLHFEIHLDGIQIDPFAWLSANAN